MRAGDKSFQREICERRLDQSMETSSRYVIFFLKISCSQAMDSNIDALIFVLIPFAVWAKRSGNELKGPVLGRYSSTTVFLSLLFSTEMSVIYSPSKPADRIRAALEAEAYNTLEYWTGSVLCIAVRSRLV